MSGRLGPSELADLRVMAVQNLYLFCKVVLGFQDMTEALHLDVCRFLQEHPSRRKRIELPRGHLKTSLTLGYALWRIVQNPNIRILIATATATNAKKWVRFLENHLEQNDLFRSLFPQIVPRDLSKVKWTESEFEVPRASRWPEATVESLGTGGTAVSRHYDLIIKDDLVNEDHLLTPEQMGKQVEWHQNSESLFVSPSLGEELLIGNRWALNDVLGWVAEHEPHIPAYKRSALETALGHDHDELFPGLLPIWPERFSKETLQAILARQGAAKFSALYLNDPMSDNPMSFGRDWYREIERLPAGVPLRYLIAIDPALSTSRSGSCTGLVALAVDPDFTMYVCAAKKDRWGVDEMIDHLFDLHEAFPAKEVGLEKVLFSKILRWPIEAAMRRHGRHFRIVELSVPTDKHKTGRISGILQEYLANGALLFVKGLVQLQKEFLEFPGHQGQQMDLLDALAHAVTMARPALQMHRDQTQTAFTRCEGFLSLRVDEMLAELSPGVRHPHATWPTWHRLP